MALAINNFFVLIFFSLSSFSWKINFCTWVHVFFCLQSNQPNLSGSLHWWNHIGENWGGCEGWQLSSFYIPLPILHINGLRSRFYPTIESNIISVTNRIRLFLTVNSNYLRRALWELLIAWITSRYIDRLVLN